MANVNVGLYPVPLCLADIAKELELLHVTWFGFLRVSEFATPLSGFGPLFRLSISDLAAIWPIHTSVVPPSRPFPFDRASSCFYHEQAVRFTQWLFCQPTSSPQDFYQPANHGDNFDFFFDFLNGG